MDSDTNLKSYEYLRQITILMSKTAILIPARYASARFPGKSLQILHKTTIIQSVYIQAKKVSNVDEVIVATDDERIEQSISDIGGKAFLTKRIHSNGTSRIAELAEEMLAYDFIINLQGDEPLINPKSIEKLGEILQNDVADIVTLKKRISNPSEIQDPNVVKVITDIYNKALYFSRAPIPYSRGNKKITYYKHIGVYGFKRETLLEIVGLLPSSLEMTEGLEQLRWIENGYAIQVVETQHDSIGIDVPKDLEKIKNIVNLDHEQ